MVLGMNYNYDLDTWLPAPPPRKSNGQFVKGHTPHNKGKKWSEYMDGRKARKIKRILLSYRQVNHNIGGWNKKQIVGISIDGKACVFESSKDVERKLGLTARNVRHCCEGKRNIVGGIFFMWAENWNGSTELSDEQKRKYEIAMKRAASRQRKSA